MLTEIERWLLTLDVIINVRYSERVDRGRTEAYQDGGREEDAGCQKGDLVFAGGLLAVLLAFGCLVWPPPVWRTLAEDAAQKTIASGRAQFFFGKKFAFSQAFAGQTGRQVGTGGRRSASESAALKFGGQKKVWRRTEKIGEREQQNTETNPSRSMAFAAEIGESQAAADLADLNAGDYEAGRSTGQMVKLLDSGDHRNDVGEIHSLQDGGQTEDEQKDLLSGQSLKPFGPEGEQSARVVQLVVRTMALN